MVIITAKTTIQLKLTRFCLHLHGFNSMSVEKVLQKRDKKFQKNKRNTFSYDKKIINAFTFKLFIFGSKRVWLMIFFPNMELFFFSFIYFYSADKCVLIYCLDVVGTTAGLSIGVLIFYFDETLRELLTEVKGIWWLLFVVLHLSQCFAGGHISSFGFVWSCCWIKSKLIFVFGLLMWPLEYFQWLFLDAESFTTFFLFFLFFM